jgi:hypothetical protein
MLLFFPHTNKSLKCTQLNLESLFGKVKRIGSSVFRDHSEKAIKKSVGYALLISTAGLTI